MRVWRAVAYCILHQHQHMGGLSEGVRGVLSVGGCDGWMGAGSMAVAFDPSFLVDDTPTDDFGFFSQLSIPLRSGLWVGVMG